MSTTSTTDSAAACPELASPGRPISRAISTGSVGADVRARNDVAPNSPSDTAAAKPAPTASARPSTGRSTVRQVRTGDEPSVAAASRRRGSIERSTGSTSRTTSGTATRAWPIGTMIHDPRRSNGAAANVISRPNPTVTADVLPRVPSVVVREKPASRCSAPSMRNTEPT